MQYVSLLILEDSSNFNNNRTDKKSKGELQRQQLTAIPVPVTKSIESGNEPHNTTDMDNSISSTIRSRTRDNCSLDREEIMEFGKCDQELAESLLNLCASNKQSLNTSIANSSSSCTLAPSISSDLHDSRTVKIHSSPAYATSSVKVNTANENISAPISVSETCAGSSGSSFAPNPAMKANTFTCRTVRESGLTVQERKVFTDISEVMRISIQ